VEHAPAVDLTGPPAQEVGSNPFGISWQKLMMWMFIVTDALLFTGFLAAYGFVRLASPAWPDRSHVFNLQLIGLMTFVLISSSATMASAAAAVARGDRRRLVRFLVLTVVGGSLFLGMQAYEWSHLIREGGTLFSNPWGVPVFTACFFLITGFHGTHVLSGVILLGTTAFRSARGRSTANGVEVAGLYWHFIDLVWVFIFTLFYLL
jgi:cytochrome c oxidase subunit III